MTDPVDFHKFILIGTAGEPTFDEVALASYHPPTNAADRVGYTTESLLGSDGNHWYVKLLLTGSWHREAKRLTSDLKFFIETEDQLLATNVDNEEIFADGWELTAYRLRLPRTGDPAGTVMVGELTWEKGTLVKVTSWYWKE